MLLRALWAGVSEVALYPLLALMATTAGIDCNPTQVDEAQAPIILVHGRASNQSIWKPLRRSLHRAGYHNVYSLNLDRHFLHVSAKSLSEYEAKLDRLIEEVYQMTGRKAILIGHSMGGLLSARAAVRLEHHVEAVIAIAAPLEGTDTIPMLQKTGLKLKAVDRAMAPGSETVLVTREINVPLYTIGADVDWVVRNKSAPKPDITIPWTGHKGVVFAPRTLKHIHQLIAKSSPDPASL